MAKKKINPLLIIALIVLGVVILSLSGIFEDLKGFTIVEIESGQTSTNIPYICPNEADECTVRGTMQCNEQIGTQTVSFRYDGDYGPGHELAIDYDNDGELESFIYFGDYHTVSNAQNLVMSQVFGNHNIYNYHPGGGWYNRVSVSYGSRAHMYILGGGISTSTQPRQPYSSNGWEIYGGEGLSYSCDGLFTVKRGTQTIYSENLNYNSNQPGTKITQIRTILSGDRASITGGSSNLITYTAYTIPACSQGATQCTPDGNGYKTCVNGEFTNLVTCDVEGGESCSQTPSGAFCKPKFILDTFKFRNSQNTQDVTAYLPEQMVNIRVRFIADNVFSQVPATIKVIKDEIQVNQFSTFLNPNEFNFFSFDSPNEAGAYEVILELSHGGRTYNIAESTFGISVTPIEASFKMDTKLIDEITGALFTSSGRFYTNNPINVEFRVFQAGDTNSLVAIDSYDITAKLNGMPINLPEPDIAVGLVRYSLILENPGLLRFEGKATKSNLQSPLVSKEITVDMPEVRASFLNVANLISLQPGTTKTIEFETRSAIGNLIDTTSTVTVLRSGGTEQTITNIQRVSTGKYSFDYQFGSVGDGPSGYQFFVTSSAENHLTSPRTTSPLVNVAPDNEEVVTECTSNAQCSGGYECNNAGSCVPITGTSPIFYLIIGIAVLLVLIVIVILIRKGRQTSFSL